MVFCTSGPNLLIIEWMDGELWCGQAQNGVNLDFQVKISPQNNRDLNQGLLHFWSKFGDPSLKGSRVIARTRKWLTHRQTHTHTDAGNDNTRKPILASGKNWWSYSPESLNSGQNRRFFAPCELKKWRTTLKINRATLLHHLKLCASFCSHLWNETV